MTRVFIYGGCVSRDAVRYYSTYGMQLAGYVSRQSLPSAFAPARLSDIEIPSSLSGFQHRMIKGDIESSLPKQLTQQASGIDLLVWDLNIERVGFQRLDDGGIITRNGAKLSSGSGQLEGVYPFGTDDHLEIWKIALDNFVSLLQDLGLLNKTFINATPWASHAAITASQWDPHAFNKLITRYWKEAEDAGVQVVYVPSRDSIADPKHKWGPAYFHYQPRAYKKQVKLIAKAAGLTRVRRLPSWKELRDGLSRHV